MISIDSETFLDTGISYLSSQDVIADTALPYKGSDHAVTLVGYKEGTAWDINNPDN